MRGASLDLPALAWWECARCPAVSAGPPGGETVSAEAWPDWWVLR